MLGRIVLLSLLAMSVASADAQGWLLGKRRADVSDEVKVMGRYRGDDRIRVSARGAPFDDSFKVGKAAIRRLAELTRDRGVARFVVTKDECWQPLNGGADCTMEAVMLRDGQPAPQATPNAPVFTVADILKAE